MADVALTSGAVPVVVGLLGVLAVLGLLAPRRLLPWGLTLGAAVVVGVAALFGLNWLVTSALSLTPEALPGPVVGWIALELAVLVLFVGNLFGTSWWRKLGAVACVVVALVATGSRINIYFDNYPTFGDLTGSSTDDVVAFQGGSDGPSASEQSPVIDRWPGAPAEPGSTVETAVIPGTVSGFVAREAYIYLPPAYHAPNRPLLPVLLLVAGEPGGPENWVTSGMLQQTLDGFAAANGGLAPVTVVVDPNGSDNGNTMCMDSTIARADTYLSTDVVNWVVGNLQVDSNHAHWAFGGWSFGGTCALQMATRHPDLFPSFMDFQGEREPALSANRAETVARAFGGDTAAFDALTPLQIMSTKRFPDSWGYFAVGEQDQLFTGYQAEVTAAARKAGMTVKAVGVPGEGHSWAVPTGQVVPALDWLGQRLGFRR